MPKVHFLDVTNRDGVQTARTGLSKFGKTMVNFYLARLGVAQSEIGFPFLFHEVPYVRANVALARAGAFGDLRLSGWCRAIAEDVERAAPLGLTHYNLSISTSDQMIAHKFRGKLDRGAIIREVTAAVAAAKAAGAQTIGVNAEDGSRTDDGFLLEFAIAAREAGADRVRYCDTIGGDSPGPDPGAVRQAGHRGRHAGRDALPQRPGHGRGQLGVRRAGRPGRRARTPGSTPASTASASGRATPTCCRASWPSPTPSASPAGPRSATSSTCPGRAGSGCGPATPSASHCPRTSRAPAGTPSPTSPASTPTAR